MRKDSSQIPYDAIRRTIERANRLQIPGVESAKLWGYLVGFFQNTFRDVYTFDSVEEFLGYNDLMEGVDRVGFRGVRVEQYEYLDCDERGYGEAVRLAVSDGTGRTWLRYFGPHMNSTEFDFLDDPVLGAREDDILDVYTAVYEGPGIATILEPWHVWNDDHEKRKEGEFRTLVEALRVFRHGTST